jgi:hypothetical protein
MKKVGGALAGVAIRVTELFYTKQELVSFTILK